MICKKIRLTVDGKETEAELTCYIKEQIEGREDALRKAVVICPGGAYAYVQAHSAAEKRAKAEAVQAHSKPFAVGERITHPIFGSGTVLSVKPLSGDVLYEVMFDSVGTKKVMGNYAKMTRIS